MPSYPSLQITANAIIEFLEISENGDIIKQYTEESGIARLSGSGDGEFLSLIELLAVLAEIHPEKSFPLTFLQRLQLNLFIPPSLQDVQCVT